MGRPENTNAKKKAYQPLLVQHVCNKAMHLLAIFCTFSFSPFAFNSPTCYVLGGPGIELR